MKRVLYSLALLLGIAVAFLAFNWATHLGLAKARLDLTEQRLYSLSEGTKGILSNLKHPIELQFVFSDELAESVPGLRQYAQRVEDMLASYVREAPQYLRLKVVYPEPFSEEEDQAASLGLQGIPLRRGGGTLYFGLIARLDSEPGERQAVEVVPFFQQSRERFLEYEISRLIQAMALPERPVVGLLSGLPMEGGFDVESQQGIPPWMLLSEIRQLFRVQALPPSLEEIPAEVSVLMLVRPGSLPESTLYAIDQFVLRGGRVLAFVDPYSEALANMQVPGLSPEGLDEPLAPLFKAWGLELVPGKVALDPIHAVPITVDESATPARNPFWLNLPSSQFNHEDVISSELENITLASAGVLRPLLGATTRFTSLLQTAPEGNAIDVSRLADLDDPSVLMDEVQPSGKPQVLAARVQGPIQTAFPELSAQRGGLTAATNINLVVVADTDTLTDGLWVRIQDFFGQPVPHPWADNATLAINALDSLSGTDALISVRSRGRYSRPFVVVERMLREAEDELREQEEQLQRRLAQTEQRLAELQQGGWGMDLGREQQQTAQQFVQEKLAIRRALREVRYSLNADIEALGTRLKLLNIVLMPALVCLLALLWFGLRRRRMYADA